MEKMREFGAEHSGLSRAVWCSNVSPEPAKESVAGNRIDSELRIFGVTMRSLNAFHFGVKRCYTLLRENNELFSPNPVQQCFP